MTCALEEPLYSTTVPAEVVRDPKRTGVGDRMKSPDSLKTELSFKSMTVFPAADAVSVQKAWGDLAPEGKICLPQCRVCRIPEITVVDYAQEALIHPTDTADAAGCNVCNGMLETIRRVD